MTNQPMYNYYYCSDNFARKQEDMYSINKKLVCLLFGRSVSKKEDILMEYLTQKNPNNRFIFIRQNKIKMFEIEEIKYEDIE
jgi:hypothetical protein